MAISADGAAEHEPEQVGLHRDVEDPPQALDVGFEQRCRIAEVETGVHHAVVHDVAVGHRRPQRLFVTKVAVAPFDVEVVDRHGQARLAQIHPYVVTAFDELAGDMGSDETARAHHEGLAPTRRFRRHDAFFAAGGE